MVERLVLVPLPPAGPVLKQDLADVELGRGRAVPGVFEGTLEKKRMIIKIQIPIESIHLNRINSEIINTALGSSD